MAQARRLAAALALVLLAGCGSSAPPPPHGGAVLRLTIAADPNTLDPAKVADLPSLNVAHEIYAGLTRFSGTGVVPDLAESWESSQNGLVWTFHLRKGIRSSDGRPITAEDFRRAWLRALAPATHSAYARVEMGNIRGARHFQATGSGEVGVEAPDDRTLRVTLQHPVPWLDQQVAYPAFFPVPRHGAWSGPFRLASLSGGRLVLERNLDYWNVAAVKPRRVVLTTSTRGVDGVLPRGLAAPGFPWIETARAPSGPGWRTLPTLSIQLLWFATRRPELQYAVLREDLSLIADGANLSRVLGGGERRLETVVPPAMPGYERLGKVRQKRTLFLLGSQRLTLAYTSQDPKAAVVASRLRAIFRGSHIALKLESVPTLSKLIRLAGPPPAPGIDLVLLGWSAEFFDAYNILDLFPCGSAFNVAQYCNRNFDRLMHQAVRTLDDDARYRIEQRLVEMLNGPTHGFPPGHGYPNASGGAFPAAPLYAESEHVFLKPGVGGFSWSPIGFYELMGMTRS